MYFVIIKGLMKVNKISYFKLSKQKSNTSKELKISPKRILRKRVSTVYKNFKRIEVVRNKIYNLYKFVDSIEKKEKLKIKIINLLRNKTKIKRTGTIRTATAKNLSCETIC